MVLHSISIPTGLIETIWGWWLSSRKQWPGQCSAIQNPKPSWTLGWQTPPVLSKTQMVGIWKISRNFVAACAFGWGEWTSLWIDCWNFQWTWYDSICIHQKNYLNSRHIQAFDMEAKLNIKWVHNWIWYIVLLLIQGLSERMAKVKRFLWALNFTISWFSQHSLVEN